MQLARLRRAAWGACWSVLRLSGLITVTDCIDAGLVPHFVTLLMLATASAPGDFQLGQDMVFFKSSKGHLLQDLMMMDKFLVAKNICDNFKKSEALKDDPAYTGHIEQLEKYVEKRTEERRQARYSRDIAEI